jgi:hypothetical protein
MLVRHPLLRLGVAPLTEDAAIEQAVEVRLDGRLLRRVPLPGHVTAEIPVDSPRWRAVPDVVSLDYVYTAPPRWREPEYRIGQTGATAPADLYVSSAGQLQGQGRSVLQLNGREVGPPGRSRGYNLVAIDPGGGIRASAGFDTHRDSNATALLAAWVAALPPGTIVMGAVSDEASAELGADAVAALGTLGVQTDMRGRFRESHAFVGVKGAPGGTALEAAGPHVVELRVGSPDDPAGFALTEFALVDSPRR